MTPLIKRWHPWTLKLWALATLLALAMWSSPALSWNPPLTDSAAFIAKIKADEAAGILTPGQGLLDHFQYAYAPQELPAEYQVGAFSPLKCGTDLVRRYQQMKDRLDPGIRQLIEGYLSTPDSRLSFTSTEGHFLLTYGLEGVNAVPAEDVDPANGIPDFVEKAGQYLEHAWTVEVLMAGFEDPLGESEPYQVSFRSMQNYGYVIIADEVLGTTRMVLHNNFEGFPPNDDPEGDIRGACKVTAAHEFKHASQFTGSRWTEGGWIEMDAVWAEELVFDQTNDYYNYLIGGSPIRHPEISLDGGSTGTGSYEDGVFEIWLQESWGTGIIVEFWQRRMVHPSEQVMESYAAVLQDHGQDLNEAWGRFTGWNYATNYRALAAVGYEEAAHYPLGPVVTTFSEFPGEYTGSVEHLAANFVRLLGFDEGLTGQLEIDFSCEPGAAPLNLTLVILKQDGTGLLESIPLTAENQGSHLVSLPIQEIQSAGLVIGNPDRYGLARSYQLTVHRHIEIPVPTLVLETSSAQLQVPAGGAAQTVVVIGNAGQENSTLHYQTSFWSTNPGLALPGTAPTDKNINGSSLVADQTEYLAGSDLILALTVNNGSTDEEWLTDVQLTFPVGVTLTGATAFSGGSLGDLVWNEVAGEGVTSSWHGEYGTQGYGVIRDGEWATAQLELSIAPEFSGPLEIEGTITGDQFGGNPHEVSVVVTLAQFAPQLVVTSPAAGQSVAIGSSLTVAWIQDETLENIVVSLSRNGGESWQDLAEVPAGQDSFTWWTEGPASMDGLVRVSGLEGQVTAYSDGRFTIYPPAQGMTCEPGAGEVPAGSWASITLECDAASLPPGEYPTWLVIQHDGPGLPGVIPVSVQVLAAAAEAGEFPLATALNGNFPNPFNPATVIRFQLDEETRVTLEVLDLKGGRVRRLLAESRAPGHHQVRWDGLDDEGRNVGAGAYLVRMRTATSTASAKIMLTK